MKNRYIQEKLGGKVEEILHFTSWFKYYDAKPGIQEIFAGEGQSASFRQIGAYHCRMRDTHESF